MLRFFSLFLNAILIATICSEAFGESQPNVLLILCDDMGWSDLGCYGGEIETSNLDRLADEGMRFTQFYNNAKCTTTRASLITGLYPRGGGVMNRSVPLLREEMLTIGEAMRRVGYRTALVGKWHLGRGPGYHPLDRGFDSFYGLLDGASNHFDPARIDPPYKGSKQRYFADGRQRIVDFPPNFYSTTAFTDRAIELLRRANDDPQPIFLHLCYTAPHYPLHAWPEDIEKYRGTYNKGWNELRRQRFAKQRRLGVIGPHWKLSGLDSQAYDWESSDQDFEDHRMAVYAAMVDRMDREIGRLLDEIERLGQTNETLILFLSDNGGCAEEPGGRDPQQREPGPATDYVAVGPAWGWAQNAPFRRYKTWMHEGGIRTPLIARWPGVIPSGTLTGQVGHIIDLFPTLLDLACADPKEITADVKRLPLDGTSLTEVFRGGERTMPAELAWDFNGNAAIRKGDWKLVWDKGVSQWELYRLDRDPTETEDLAPSDPKRCRQMALAYNAWAKRTANTLRPVPSGL